MIDWAQEYSAVGHNPAMLANKLKTRILNNADFDIAEIQAIADTGFNLADPQHNFLMPAITARKTDAAIALIKAGVDVNVATPNGKTPLIWAVLYEDCKVIKELVKANVDANLRNEDGETALHFAVRSPDAEAVTKAIVENNSKLTIETLEDVGLARTTMIHLYLLAEVHKRKEAKKEYKNLVSSGLPLKKDIIINARPLIKRPSVKGHGL